MSSSDILIGKFWTSLGTNTGVAESGTVEETNQFVADDRPAMLYFSKRKPDSQTLALSQQKKLRAFKAATIKRALVGSFHSVAELRRILLRDLVSQVRKTKAPLSRSSRIEKAKEITELIVMHKKYKITPGCTANMPVSCCIIATGTRLEPTMLFPKAKSDQIDTLSDTRNRKTRWNGCLTRSVPAKHGQ